jgi:hypothetical protein
MSMMARLNANLEAAIAEQRARHAAEEGRDIAREQCLEAMARAIKPEWFGDSGVALSNYEGQDLKYQDYASKQAYAALDAAISSGYVVVKE